jgi:NADH-quinone oxidoreductase subunit E
MPEITVIHIAALFIAVLLGIVIGWFVRGGRSASEKAAINAGWQEQLLAQRGEHERLLEQNKSLMDQNSQYQASNKDAKMRASELSDALKEAFERRDALQRQIKDIRGNLETAVSERDQLQSDMQSQAWSADSAAAALKERDERIEKLNKELENWHNRLPPLIERFRIRNLEAEELESELAAARERITALEDMMGSEQTRVEPVDQDALRDGMDASNDPIEEPEIEESEIEASEIQASEIEAQEIEEHDAADPDARNPSNIAAASDNLKLIKGVGPAIEKTLNEMGIFRFNQIAEMSEYDIDRIARRLKGFHSRIYREDWIGQARDLQSQEASGQQ